MPWVIGGTLACVVPIFFLYEEIVGSYGVAAAMAAKLPAA